MPLSSFRPRSSRSKRMPKQPPRASAITTMFGSARPCSRAVSRRRCRAPALLDPDEVADHHHSGGDADPRLQRNQHLESRHGCDGLRPSAYGLFGKPLWGYPFPATKSRSGFAPGVFISSALCHSLQCRDGAFAGSVSSSTGNSRGSHFSSRMDNRDFDRDKSARCRAVDRSQHIINLVIARPCLRSVHYFENPSCSEACERPVDME